MKCLSNNSGVVTQALAVLAVSICLFVGGFHSGWSGPSLRKILSGEYAFEVSEDEASYIAIVGPAGDIIGGILSSTLVDIIGRRKTLLYVFLPQVLTFLTIYFSYLYKELLYCGRVFGGIGEGAVLAIAPLYIAEVTEPKVRGMLGTFVALSFVCGKLFINVLGSYLDIHNTALVCMIFSVLFVICFYPMPETPYFHLMKGRKEEAESSLKYLRKSNNVTKEMIKLTSDVNRQMSESGGYKDLFLIETNRKAFLIVLGLRIFQQCTGCTAFSTYVQILIADGTNLSPVLGSSLIIIVQIIATVTSTFTVDKFGRKPLFIISSASCFLVLSSLAIFFTLRDYVQLDMDSVAWLPLVFMLIFIVSFQLGFGAAMNIFISEMYSASIKAKGLSVGSVIFSLSMIGTIKFYQFTADTYQLAVPFYSFAIVTFFAILFCIFILPETKGKSLEEIQQNLKGIKYVDRKTSFPECF